MKDEQSKYKRIRFHRYQLQQQIIVFVRVLYDIPLIRFLDDKADYVYVIGNW
jgi:hypothetical protein